MFNKHHNFLYSLQLSVFAPGRKNGGVSTANRAFDPKRCVRLSRSNPLFAGRTPPFSPWAKTLNEEELLKLSVVALLNIIFYIALITDGDGHGGFRARAFDHDRAI